MASKGGSSRQVAAAHWWQQQHLMAAAAADEMAAAVRQAAAAGRAAAAVDWRNRKRLRKDWEGLAEEATAEWRELVVYILGKQGERTTEEDAVVWGFTRGHTEVTAAKGKEAAAELAATRRAAAEKAGSNMGRYDEILERNKALEVGFDKEDEKDMEDWEEDCEVAW